MVFDHARPTPLTLTMVFFFRNCFQFYVSLFRVSYHSKWILDLKQTLKNIFAVNRKSPKWTM